uniref:LisH domain and HEAT repeat-containing protein KIAA1468 n=1 Tax=Phallusia mammillata TaxID=59560 RepID=A0A6F9DF25_9ASCI|nr:lisH domain and HEAT repeat-containing protein KIAA1468 [Phallusia mammillata]
MSGSNPFLDDDSDSETPKHVYAHQSSPAKMDGEIPVDILAEQLLKKNYVLTALELYTEMQERGKDLPRLRNFFSNPSNFEQQINCKETSEGLYRTSSCSTFDSLDITRFSDDGQQVDERIAVLEFELRKAKDTIKSLRANLTNTAEQEASCLQNITDEAISNGQIELGNGWEVETEEAKPLEIRAINHLVNEYLTDHQYKLSAITFADENEEQDFEDWHDVGLNTAKPPGLLNLYRDFNNHVIPSAQLKQVGTMTEEMETNSSVEVADLNSTVETLQKQVMCFEKENLDLQKELENCKREAKFACEEIVRLQSMQAVEVINDCTNVDGNITTSPTEIIENKQLVTEDIIDGSATKTTQNSDTITPETIQLRNGQLTTPFWNALYSKVQSNVENSWLKEEILNVCKTPEQLTSLLTKCLPHIVPTVLLAKRDQLIPLLLSAAALHPEISTRNELVNILFNLIKKPDETERQMILLGCVAYAKHIGESRSEEELLPQCWEQIGHKYPERRQLVAEACGAIAPYLRAEMRGSLLVSILQQIEQEEKMDAVRCSVVKSLALIHSLQDDDDKYKQAFQLMRSFLRDKSSTVREIAVSTYLPAVALWSINRCTLHSHLYDQLLSDLENALNDHNQKDTYAYASIAEEEFVPVYNLLSYLYSAVLLEIQEANDNPSIETSASVHELPPFKHELNDPRTIVGDETKCNKLIQSFDQLVENDAKLEGYELLSWTVNQFIPRFLKICKFADPSSQPIVKCLCDFILSFQNIFGSIFYENKVWKRFVSFLEECPENHTTCVLPVYVATISSLNSESVPTLNEFLLQSIVSLSKSELSMTAMLSTLTSLRSNPQHHDAIVQVLWSGVMHESPLVRAASAQLSIVMTTADVKAHVLSSRILPALITLSTDETIEVRVATIPAFASVVENPSVTADAVERVITQMIDVVSASTSGYHEHSHDGTLLGLHSVQLQLVTTACKIAPTAHPKFRDEFLLPHLVVIAASNSQQKDRSKRSEIALLLLETYTNLSCCFIPTNLLHGSFLPALKCLLLDIETMHPERSNEVSSLLNEVEQKLERGSIVSEGSPRMFHRGSGSIGGLPLGQVVTSGADDARKKILTTWDQIKFKAPPSPTMFRWKK